MGWIRKQLGITDKIHEAREAERLVQDQRAEEEAAKQRRELGKAAIKTTLGKFNDAHFAGVEKSYQDFARPQLDEQVAKGRNDMTMHLARNGILNSSARNASEADLQSQYSKGLQDITQKGQEVVSTQRDALENYRANLLNTLETTADNNLIAQQANARAASLAQPQAFSPLTEMIKMGSAQLGNQLQLERASLEYGGTTPTFWSGAFGARPGSSTVTRR